MHQKHRRIEGVSHKVGGGRFWAMDTTLSSAVLSHQKVSLAFPPRIYLTVRTYRIMYPHSLEAVMGGHLPMMVLVYWYGSERKCGRVRTKAPKASRRPPMPISFGRCTRLPK